MVKAYDSLMGVIYLVFWLIFRGSDDPVEIGTSVIGQFFSA